MDIYDNIILYFNTLNIMATLSIPVSKEYEEFIEREVRLGKSENKAAVVRKALRLLAEQEAIFSVLKAEQEPNLSGDLDKLAKKIK